ncbi:MAG: DUF29 domain-containing protein [Cyanobacteria bacterium J06621_8]
MTNLNQLYHRDFNLWVEQIKTAIHNQNLEAMDWDNLLDEIDDMGKSEKRSLESYLELLIAHILKIKYWESEKERNCKHWQVEVRNFRNRIQRLLKRSPSLEKYLQEVYPEILEETINTWKIEFDIPQDTTISLIEIMKNDYFG